MPQKPGIYIFTGKGGKRLYVGKAGNLKARVKSYFAKSNLSHKTASLLNEAAEISWEILASEAEALIRESELIKKHHPKFNVLMRDDKQYIYVLFTKERFPRIFTTHQASYRKADYLGPFTEAGVLKSVLRSLRKYFPYCTCKKPHKGACLNTRIGRCPGYCCILPSLYEGESPEGEVYKKNISSIKKILSGKSGTLSRELKKEMKKLSHEQKYEEAAKARNQINALARIFEQRSVVKRDLPSDRERAIYALKFLLGLKDISRMEAYDIANIQGKFAYGSMAVFSAQGGPASGRENGFQKSEYRIFRIKTVLHSDDTAMLREVLFRRLNHSEWNYPEVILIDGGKAQLNAAMSTLAKFRLPIKMISLTKNKKHKGESVLFNNRPAPMPLEKLPESLKNLLLSANGEAHRFAIKFYRKLHRKNFSDYLKG